MLYLSIIICILLLVLGLFAVSTVRKGLSSKRNAKPVVIIMSIMALLCLGLGIWGVQLKKDADESAQKRQSIEQAREQMQGLPAPDFEGVTPQGDSIHLSDFIGKGQYVLLDLWASWCGPCKRYLPIIRGFDEKYPNLTVIGVNVNDKMDDALKAISDENMTWDIIITEGSTVTKLYNCIGIPSCYIIDPDGIMVVAGMHPANLESEIENYITPSND